MWRPIQADGDVGLVYFCPANSVKITYEPANGVVEVFSRDRNLRAEVFKLFARHVLGHAVEAQAVPLRNYAIASLAIERYFPLVDPEIAAVRVTELRLRVGARGSAIVLKIGDRDPRTLYGLAAETFGDGNPLEQAYHLDQACIVIKFHKTRWPAAGQVAGDRHHRAQRLQHQEPHRPGPAAGREVSAPLGPGRAGRR